MNIYYENKYQLWVMRILINSEPVEFVARTVEELQALYRRSKGLAA